MTASEKKPASTHAQPSRDTPKTLRILVIDDSEASAKTLGWMLEALGHEVKVLLNAKDAIAQAPGYKPDAVLMDIGLPDMNGFDACKIMRSEPSLKDTVFIAQTGWGEQEHFQRSRDSGFNAHLIKPISFEALERQLRSIKAAS